MENKVHFTILGYHASFLLEHERVGLSKESKNGGITNKWMAYDST